MILACLIILAPPVDIDVNCAVCYKIEIGEMI
jgi:hypothetical protein